MDVEKSAAELKGLFSEFKGDTFYFCSNSCLQCFQMNPRRFAANNIKETLIAKCELCSKTISETEAYSQVDINGQKYKFCCPTCASVFAGEKTAEIKDKEYKNQDPKPVKNTDIYQWLQETVKQHASDLFLSVGEVPVLKVYDVFKKITKHPLKRETIDEFIQAIIPERKCKLFEEGHDVDIGLDVQGLARFRINIFRQQNGNSIAIRPLPYEILEIEDLMLPDVYRDLQLVKRGMILITGPTGSGKTTTLASFINAINQRYEKHIITIEDPIEYVIPSQKSLIHQREVGWHTQSFGDGLRSALRENPDIIVVGELRDLESISLAIRAAETGHLVLGTLHSGTAIQTLSRILDVFDSERQSLIRTQLAQSLQAICSQRLIKRIDREGMIVATEIMIATLALRNIIRQDRVQEIRGYIETGQREKMHTLKQSIQGLIDKSFVLEESLDEVKEDILIN
ncbi:MAG: PilT/PilU family type 4a pilus ATPase [Candidatus Omnitrophica bacterium]|nr:PilT/PilU family type 4a pilus ATPase [Candidatus Omnitrophota bacterium]